MCGNVGSASPNVRFEMPGTGVISCFRSIDFEGDSFLVVASIFRSRHFY